MRRETERLMERLREAGYENLTNDERFKLALRFRASGDDDEEEKLRETAPRETYRMIEADLVNQFREAETFALQCACSLIRTDAVFTALDTLTERETTMETMEGPDGDTIEYEAAQTPFSMMEMEERELFNAGVMAGDDSGEVDLDALEVPGHVRAPTDALEHVSEYMRRVHAARMVEVWETFDELARERFDVELEEIVRAHGAELLPILERCRELLEEADDAEQLRERVDTEGLAARAVEAMEAD